MKKEKSLIADSFEKLLNWLNPDRDKAGDKYEEIRVKLIDIFARRGCLSPDELADKTIDRVIHKAPEIADSYSGDPNLYFYTVAKFIYKEHLRDLHSRSHSPVYIEPQGQDERLDCLDKCLAELSKKNREFILQYFKGEKSEKIKCRREMAESAGATIETIRMRAHRIKATLKKCVRGCLAKTR